MRLGLIIAFCALMLIFIAGSAAAQACKPICDNIGTRTEGWYDSCSGELIKYDKCSRCSAVCRGEARNEGWYSSCNNTLIKYENCSKTEHERKPDIVISDVEMVSAGAAEGSVFKIKYTVESKYANSSQFFVSLYVDGFLKATSFVSGMKKDESKTKTFEFTYYQSSCSGYFDTIEITADYKNNIDESDENNNKYTLKWSCQNATEIPKILPKTEVITPELVLLPDLKVTNITYLEASYLGWKPKDLTIIFYIKNAGPVSSGKFRYTVKINDEEFYSDDYPEIFPNQEYKFILEKKWTPQWENNTIEVCVDVDKEVTELNETNNCKKTKIFLKLSCNDGVKNRDEEDVDCGGSYCLPCGRCDPDFVPPKYFDLRNYYQMPPVRDQGHQCGSCWAHAAIGTIEIKGIIESGYSPNFDLSEQYLISCGPGSCNGGYISTAFNFTKNNYVVTENCFPYQQADVPCNPCNLASERYGIKNYTIIKPEYTMIKNTKVKTGNITEIKKALVCHGPLAAASTNNKHAVVFVGWNDTKGAWIIRNSWGSNWSDNGYGYIPYYRGNRIDIMDDNLNNLSSFDISFPKYSGLAVGDFDGDGKDDEIVVADRVVNKFSILGFNGNTITTFGVKGGFPKGSSLVSGDLNGDGKDEIIFASVKNKEIKAFDYITIPGSNQDIAILAQFKYNIVEGNDIFTAGDVDGDNMDEIIHANVSSDKIKILDMNGNVESQFNINIAEHDGLASGDVDGDGIDEIVYGSTMHDDITVYDKDGNILSSIQVNNFRRYDGLATGDIDGDGKDEILYLDRSNDIMHVIKYENMLNEEKTFNNFDYQVGDRVVCGDVNGDGKQEIVYAINPANSDYKNKVGYVEGVFKLQNLMVVK